MRTNAVAVPFAAIARAFSSRQFQDGLETCLDLLHPRVGKKPDRPQHQRPISGEKILTRRVAALAQPGSNLDRRVDFNFRVGDTESAAGDLDEDRIVNEAVEKVCLNHDSGPLLRPGEIAKLPVDLDDITARLRALGYPVALSDDAGGYLCDAVYFHALDHAAAIGSPAIVAFIHIPTDLDRGLLTRELAGSGAVESVGACVRARNVRA